MKTSQKILLLVFGMVVTLQLIGNWTGNLFLEYLAKPLIMPSIALIFLTFAKKMSFRRPVLLAFLFCWLGDVFLLLANSYEVLFYAGVGGFFIGQLFYIRVFTGFYERRGFGLLRKKPWVIVPYLVVYAALLWILFPVMESFMKPVIAVYGFVLILMALAAADRWKKVSKSVFNRIFVGSIFFVVSDSLIAFNKFHTEIDKAGFFIMSTYILAQSFILWGLISEKEKA